MHRRELLTLTLAAGVAGLTGSDAWAARRKKKTYDIDFPRIVNARALPVDMQSAEAWMNAFRRSRRKGPVAADPRLERIARAHALDMARNGFFDHNSPHRGGLKRRVLGAGYPARFAAENIAWGQKSLEEALAGWEHSPGHRRNMLDRRAKAFGIGWAEGNYWVMVLGAA